MNKQSDIKQQERFCAINFNCRTSSMEDSRKTAQALTQAYEAAMKEIIQASDLSDDAKFGAVKSVKDGVEDLFTDVDYEFDQEISALKIEAE